MSTEELEWNLIRAEAVRPRTSHTVTSYGNALVVIGGEDGSGGPILPAVEFLYPDPPANNANAPAVVEPKKTGVGPKSLFSHATVRVGNKFYIYGGFVEGELSSKINIMTVINDDTVHWSQPRITGDNPPPLKGHSLLRYDKRLVLFGGTDGKSFFNDTFFFDTGMNFH
jgi:N-acetylneuraminic acid mutarotase